MFAEEFDPYQENSLDLLLKFSHETAPSPELPPYFAPHPASAPLPTCPDYAEILHRFEEPPTSALEQHRLELDKMRKAADAHEQQMSEIREGGRRLRKVHNRKEERTEESENSPQAGRKRKHVRKPRL
jgi:hypothetical protein